jgi:hypothetical protein
VLYLSDLSDQTDVTLEISEIVSNIVVYQTDSHLGRDDPKRCNQIKIMSFSQSFEVLELNVEVQFRRLSQGVVNTDRCPVLYYESINRELQIRPKYDCRYDERLKTKTEDSTVRVEKIVRLVSGLMGKPEVKAVMRLGKRKSFFLIFFESSTHGRRRPQGFLPQLDAFYFTTDEKKILENCRCIVPNFMND